MERNPDLFESLEELTEQEQRLVGHLGWTALTLGIIAWDIKAPETLTASYGRGLDNNFTKPFVIGATAITVGHLMRAIPREYDPFYVIPKKIGELWKNQT